jgi:hypothetical protein
MTNALRVFANPYLCLDPSGRPCGACPADPAHLPDRREWVGAWLDAERTKVLSTPERGEVRAPVQDTIFAFSQSAIELPATPGYLDRIRCGELLAADAPTARAAGIAFVPPDAALERARAVAIAAWKSLYGEEPHGLADFTFVLHLPAPEPES